ncbi:MAG: type ISP restriction/modification enzyme, partial [Mariprofundaceae bacterium]|nr:type ISP restriction/modification enzyme [Mariprofundaceae bacterium]
MTAKVFHAHLWGKREQKYATLEEEDVSSIKWTEVEPESPFYLFIPQDKGAWKEYQQGWSLPDIFPVNVLGFQTHRDHFAVAFTRDEMEARVADMRNPGLTNAELRAKYNLKDNRDWKLAEARKLARKTSDSDVIRDCLYRPFDARPCYFSYEAMDYPRRELMDHIASDRNLSMIVGRQGQAVEDPVWALLSCSDSPHDANIYRRGGGQAFLLYVYPTDNEA